MGRFGHFAMAVFGQLAITYFGENVTKPYTLEIMFLFLQAELSDTRKEKLFKEDNYFEFQN